MRRLRRPRADFNLFPALQCDICTLRRPSRCSFALVVPTDHRCPRHHRIPRLHRMTAPPPPSACPCPSARGDSIGERGGTRERNGQRRVCLRCGVIKREEARPLPLPSSGAKGELKDVSGADGRNLHRCSTPSPDSLLALHTLAHRRTLCPSPPECRNNRIC